MKNKTFGAVLLAVLLPLLSCLNLSAQQIENGKLISWSDAKDNIKIPDGVTEIADNCFYEAGQSDPNNPWNTEDPVSNTKITSVDFNNVTLIGKNAFKGCTGIKTVNAPKVETVKDEAFEGCTALETLNLPAGRVIAVGAFANNSDLTMVTIGKQLTALGENPFRNCPKLATLTVDAACPAFFSEGNAIIRTADGILLCLAGAAEQISIGERCKGIGTSGMSNCSLLSKINLPYAVSIGDKALTQCSSLAELLMPRLESVNDNSYITFNGVGALQIVDVHLNPSFSGFGGALPDRAETKIYVADEVVKTTLQKEFKSAQIIVGAPGDLQNVRVSFSHNEGGVMEAWLPGGRDIQSGGLVPAGSTVTFKATPRFNYEIASWELNGKPITEGLDENRYVAENIQADVNLKVTFRERPEGCYIFFKSHAPEFGTLLCRIEGGGEIKSGDKVPTGSRLVFTAKPNKGFRATDWLKDEGEGMAVKYVKIEGLTGQTTYTCPAEDGLDIHVDFDRIKDHYIVRYRSYNETNGKLTAALSDGTAIAPSEAVLKGSKIIFTAHPAPGMAVENWYSEDEVIAGQTAATYIVAQLSSDIEIAVLCTTPGTPQPGEHDPVIKNGHLISWKPAAGAAILPSEVAYIDGKAFEGADEMTTLKLNSSVKYIGELAFLYAAELKSFEVPAENPYFTAVDGVLYNKEKTRLIAYPAGKEDKYYTILATATSVMPGAFAATPRLAGVKVADGNTALKATSGLLFNADLTTLFYFPNGFSSEPVSEVVLPQGLQCIERLSLAYVPGLAKLELPSSLKTIEALGVSYNPALQNLKLSEGATMQLETIADSAFYYSRSLTALPYIPSLRHIGEASFAICSAMEDLHIPAGCTIGNKAFFQCQALKQVYAYDKTPADIKAETFVGIAFPQECTLFVPKGSKETYAAATGWSVFAGRITETEGLGSSAIIAACLTVSRTDNGFVISGIASGVNCRLFDLSGKLIYAGRALADKFYIRNLAPGTYILSIDGTTPVKLQY